MVIASIDPELLRQLGTELTSKTSHGMLEAIKDHLAPDCSAQEHECLMRKAQDIRIRRRGSAEHYLERHRALRVDMLRAEYPNIDTESTTVVFAI